MVGLRRIRLHEYIPSFKRKNDVTQSNDTIGVILQLQLTSASPRFPRAFKTVTKSFDITRFYSIGSIGEMC